MYEAYWGLSSKPFTGRTATVRRFRSHSQHTALLRLHYAFEHAAEAALVLGGSGLGKSTVIRLLQAEQPERQTVLQVVFPSLSPIELLRVIADDLNPGHTDSLATAPADALLMSIRSSLRRLADSGHRAIVCFDDAHLLSSDAFIRTVQPLLNLADSDANVDLSVVLAGQPLLMSRLARQPQLNERIGVLTTLQGFSFAETATYVTGQLAAAGCQHEIFTDAAIQRLFELSQGNPRRVNRLCDMALLVSCADQQSQVTDREVEAVAAELLPAAA